MWQSRNAALSGATISTAHAAIIHKPIAAAITSSTFALFTTIAFFTTIAASSLALAATVSTAIAATALRVSIAAGDSSSAAGDSEGGRGLLDGLRQQRWCMPWVLRCVWRVLPAVIPA